MHTEQVPKRVAFLPALGVSLLSAVGSLPMHLAPFLTATLITESKTSVAGAGWVWSIAYLGELAASVALPLIGKRTIRRSPALLAAIALMTGLALSTSRQHSVFLLGWFMIGSCCGILKYLGAMAASQSSQPAFMFGLRLSVVLILAGSIAIFLRTVGALASHEAVLIYIGIALTLVFLLGMCLHRDTPNGADHVSDERGVASNSENHTRGTIGLAIIFLLFVGSSGVLVFVLHQAVARGMNSDEVAAWLAATKVASGIWLIIVGLSDARSGRTSRLAVQSAILALATVAINHSRDAFTLFVAVLFWEFAMNRVSPTLQAMVVRQAPRFAGQWINASILLGSATGLMLNGYLVGIGCDGLYVLLSVVTVFAPAAWAAIVNRNSPRCG